MKSFFKKMMQKYCFLKSKLKSFKNLELGDIVWAKMPLSRRDMKRIELDHRVRPYLIVYKSKFYIYAFQSSSKKWKNAYNSQEYKINRLRYHIHKDSFITLRKIYKIPFWNIKSNYFKLQEIDLKNIQKRLDILNCKYHYAISYSLEEGDVIKIDDQLYYIYTSDNTNIYCLIIYPKKPSNQYEVIKINHKNFYTKFEKKASFSRKKQVQLMNVASREEMEEIQKQIKAYKRKKVKKS